MAPYVPTVWVNDVAPALSAANLNKLTNELKAQATTQGVTNTLPTWTDNAGPGPALTDGWPWNEIERVTYQVALTLGLTYSGTSPWDNGWTPARNAYRLNLIEQGAAANRTTMEAAPPPTGTLYDQLSDFYFQPWGGTYLINAYYRVYPTNGYQLLGSGGQWPLHGGYYGVIETTTVHGPGFYFRVWPEQVHGTPAENNKSCFITDANHIWPSCGNLVGNAALNAPFIGKTTDVNFWFMLPSSGNPSFAAFTGWNCLMEYHPGGSYPVNNQLGVDPSVRSGFPNGCIYVRCHDGNNSDAGTPDANYGRVPLVLDHWYQYRRLDTWSRTNGTTQAWIDGTRILNQSGVGNVQANPHGTAPNQEYADIQPNFGYYSGSAAQYPQNEVYFADVRITVT